MRINTYVYAHPIIFDSRMRGKEVRPVCSCPCSNIGPSTRAFPGLISILKQRKCQWKSHASLSDSFSSSRQSRLSPSSLPYYSFKFITISVQDFHSLPFNFARIFSVSYKARNSIVFLRWWDDRTLDLSEKMRA